MWKNCHEWRKSAEGVGIDELYRRIDPFDVRSHIFRPWTITYVKSSTQSVTMYFSFGRSSSTK